MRVSIATAGHCHLPAGLERSLQEDVGAAFRVRFGSLSWVLRCHAGRHLGGFSRSPAPGVLDNRSNTAAVCADRPYAAAHPELVRGHGLQQPRFQIQMPLALEFVFKTGQPNERKL